MQGSRSEVSWVSFANRDRDSSLALARAALARYLAAASP